MLPLYRGFSTLKSLQTRGKTLSVVDAEAIKADLLNHIYTIRGERIHQPDFGTRIPLMAFEPLDELTLDIIEEDLRAVVDFDPRVELLEIDVSALPDNSAVLVLLDLLFLNTGQAETVRLEVPLGS